MNHENKTPKFQFTQNTNGLHVIRDTAGNELTIDTTQQLMYVYFRFWAFAGVEVEKY